MKPTGLLMLLLLSNIGKICGQPKNSYMADAILPPPSSSSLGKFTDIPVNSFTGIPRINIPIYTLKEGPLELSVSLDYHASGIRVQEVASRVGLGWAFNAGGQISRTILGAADEDPIRGYWLFGTQVNQSYQSIRNVGTNFWDGEPDLFSFTFPGYNGKFIIDRNHQPILIPQQDLKIVIDYDGVNRRFKRFVITDPTGVRYIFGTPEGTNSPNIIDKLETDIKSPMNVGSPDNDQAWNLVEIKSSDNKYKIGFDYEPDTYSYRSMASYGLDINKCLSPTGASTETIVNNGIPYSLSNGRTHYTYINNFTGFRLKNITTSTEYLQLNGAPAGRLDLEAIYEGGASNSTALSNIQLFTNASSPYRTLTWRLENSYFFDNTVTQSVGKRLKLDSLWLEYSDGNVGIINQIYRFKYLTNNNFLPHRLSSGIDHWGFNNGKYSVNTDNLNIPVTTLIPPYSSPSVTKGNALTNRNTDTSAVKQGVLNEIQYPTGGFTRFIFEANDYPKPPSGTLVDTFFRHSNCVSLSNVCCGMTLGKSFTLTSTQLNPKISLKLTALDINSALSTAGCGTDIIVDIWITDASNNTLGTHFGFNIDLDLGNPKYIKEAIINFANLNFFPQVGVSYNLNIVANRGRGEISFSNEVTQNNLINTPVGGLRIKEIRHISNKDPDVVKTYEYKLDNGNSSGVLYTSPIYGIAADAITATSPTSGSTAIIGHMHFSSDCIVPLGAFDGYHIAYSKVVEKSKNNGQKLMQFDITQSPPSNLIYPTPPPLYSPGHGDQLLEEIRSQNNSVVQSNTMDYLRGSSTIPNLFLKVYTTSINCSGATEAFNYKVYYPLTGFSRIHSKTSTIDGVSSNQVFQYDFSHHLQPTVSTLTNSNGQITTHNIKYITDLPDGTLKSDLITRNLILPAIEDDMLVDNIQVDGDKIDYSFYDASGNPTSSINVPYAYIYSKYRATESTSGLFTGQWVVEGTNNLYDMTQGKPSSFTSRGWLPTMYTWQNGQIKSRTFKDHSVSYTYISGTRLLSSIIDIDGQAIYYFYDPILRLDSIRARSGNVTTRFQYQFKNIPSSQNWIKSTTRYAPVVGSDFKIKEDFQYFDGLGRAIQTVKKSYSPIDKLDVITGIDYDEEGRIIKSYEPFKSTVSSGSYSIIPGTTKYTSTVYESSLLNRPMSSTPPDWFATNQSYMSNNSADAVGYFDGVNVSSSYPVNTLIKSISQDPDGNKKITFLDKKGRTILQRKTDNVESITSFNDTYMLYDLKDRIKSIIPPGATLSTPDLIFAYTYDQFNNVLSKKVPGQAKTQSVYDTRDLPIAFQNGLLLSSSLWIGNLYDDYGRMVESGYTSSSSFSSLNSRLIQHFYDGYDGSTQLSLSNYPQYVGKIRKSRTNNLNGFAAGDTWNESTYTYDNFGRNTLTANTNHIANASDAYIYLYDYSDHLVQSTRTHTAYSNFNFAIDRKYTFDHQGRPLTSAIQIGGAPIKIINNKSYSIKDEITQNIIGEGLQTIDYTYNTQSWLTGINSTRSATDLFSEELKYFDAQVGSGYTPRRNGSISQQTIESVGRQKQFYNFIYDYLDRLALSTTGEYNNGSYTLNNKYNESYTYDPRGNILSLSRRGEMPTGIGTFQNSVIDNLSYAYTPNTNTLSTVTDAPVTCPTSYLVAQDIYAPINISASSTLTANNTVDGSNVVRYTAGSSISLLPGFSTEAYGNGNVLASIAACGNTAPNPEGISQSTINPYLYDVDGDQVFDPNKAISFAYNYMHLPFVALNSSGCNRIEWIYDASGKKVQQKTYTKGILTQTIDYLDGIEYKTIGTNSPFLDAIYHEEGRYVGLSQKYEYIVKDHLGNTRLSFIDSDGNGSISTSEITQESYYYSFGMSMKGPWTNANTYKYQYNGKENVVDIGLGLIDYGARWYDSGVGRWTSVDPMGENRAWANLFNYTQNNPILRIDNNGALDDHYINTDGSIESVKTDDTYDRFYIQNTCSDNCGDIHGYTQVAQLEKNEQGLVKFPSGGHAFGRYGPEDEGGFDIAQNEQIGFGDHYLKPETAAALFGVISTLTESGINVKFGDMSSSNGSDPSAPGEKHHNGHGHNGKLSGQDIDFRYVNTNGNSFKSAAATTSVDFSSANNQLIYNTANHFGFTNNYQGNSGERMNNASRVDGHNDHGHLGLNYGNLNWKYVNTAPRN